MALDTARSALERRLPRPETALALFIAAIALCFVVATAQTEPAEDARSWLLTLGLLPLINAVFDTASAGATRLFLRRGMAGNAGRWAAVDLAVGAAAFIGLGCAAIALVHAIVALGGPALIDLAVLFGDETVPGSILNDPHAYWWLYLTFLTTLLPTLAHATLFLVSAPLTAPGFVRRGVAGLLVSGARREPVDARWGLLFLCGLLSAGIVLPPMLLWYAARGLWLAHPHIGEALLSVFRGFAVAIGAI